MSQPTRIMMKASTNLSLQRRYVGGCRFLREVPHLLKQHLPVLHRCIPSLSLPYLTLTLPERGLSQSCRPFYLLSRKSRMSRMSQKLWVSRVSQMSQKSQELQEYSNNMVAVKIIPARHNRVRTTGWPSTLL